MTFTVFFNLLVVRASAKTLNTAARVHAMEVTNLSSFFSHDKTSKPLVATKGGGVSLHMLAVRTCFSKLFRLLSSTDRRCNGTS